MRTGRMHSAKLENSPRLQKLLAFLRERREQGATTREIIMHFQGEICAVNSVADELRDNGFTITCVREANPHGKGAIFRYTLIEAQAEPTDERVHYRAVEQGALF